MSDRTPSGSQRRPGRTDGGNELATRIPLDDLERVPTERTLRELVERHYTLKEILEFVDASETVVRQQLDRFGLEPDGWRARSDTIAGKLMAADSLEEVFEDDD